MKTPSSLVIAVFIAALPVGAAAERKPGERCDTPFLEKVVKEFTGIDSVKDDRIKKADIAINGETYRQDVLKSGDTATCDAGTWWHLAPGATPAWRNAEAKKYWETGSAKQNAALLLVADGFFKSFDPKVAEALAAADEVIAAGIAIGVAEAADFPKEHIEFLKANSGGALAVSAPKSVALIASDKQKAGTVAPAQVNETWRKLLDNKGETKAGGAAVLRFRQAVLALGAEIGRQGDPAGSKIPGVSSFAPGLPSGFAASNFDKAAAANDDKYRVGLAALAGKASVPPAALNDAAPRAGALLDLVDIGLRNLIAIRAAQVEDIVAAAKVKLGARTIAAIVTSARGSEAAKGATPLGGAAITALSKTPEYMQLDALYDQSVAGKGANDPATKAIAQAREDMKSAALSAALEPDASGRQSVVFSQGERKTVLGSIVPPEEGAKGDAARENAAAVVARFIVDGAKASDLYDTLKRAVLDPNNDPGKTMPSDLKGPEIAVSKEVPPAIAKINADGAGCKNPNDIVRNNYESYAARKQAAAAEMASGNARSRSEIEALEAKEKAASAVECKRRKDEAAALQADTFTKDETLTAMRARATAKAEKWCTDDLAGIGDRAAKAQAKLKAEVEGARDPGKGLTQANADLEAAFGVAVTGSVSTLRGDYTNPAGGPRQKKLAADAGLNSLSLPRLRAFSKLWFMERWPEGDELSGTGLKADERKKALSVSLAKCKADLGFAPIKDKGSKVSYSNPETPDTVAKKCGIQKDLTEWISKLKGTVTDQP